MLRDSSAGIDEESEAFALDMRQQHKRKHAPAQASRKVELRALRYAVLTAKITSSMHHNTHEERLLLLKELKRTHFLSREQRKLHLCRAVTDASNQLCSMEERKRSIGRLTQSAFKAECSPEDHLERKKHLQREEQAECCFRAFLPGEVFSCPDKRNETAAIREEEPSPPLYSATGEVYLCVKSGCMHVCTVVECERQVLLDRSERIVCELTHRDYGAPLMHTEGPSSFGHDGDMSSTAYSSEAHWRRTSSDTRIALGLVGGGGGGGVGSESGCGSGNRNANVGGNNSGGGGGGGGGGDSGSRRKQKQAAIAEERERRSAPLPLGVQSSMINAKGIVGGGGLSLLTETMQRLYPHRQVNSRRPFAYDAMHSHISMLLFDNHARRKLWDDMRKWEAMAAHRIEEHYALASKNGGVRNPIMVMDILDRHVRLTQRRLWTIGYSNRHENPDVLLYFCECVESVCQLLTFMPHAWSMPSGMVLSKHTAAILYFLQSGLYLNVEYDPETDRIIGLHSDAVIEEPQHPAVVATASKQPSKTIATTTTTTTRFSLSRLSLPSPQAPMQEDHAAPPPPPPPLPSPRPYAIEKITMIPSHRYLECMPELSELNKHPSPCARSHEVIQTSKVIRECYESLVPRISVVTSMGTILMPTMTWLRNFCLSRYINFRDM